MENIEKIIRERHSVRSYLDREIEKEKQKAINELINKINKEQNLNIQLILNDKEVFDKFILHYGRLKNCKNYIALIGKKEKSLDEKVGYYGEQIVLKAQEIGLNTCWVAGTSWFNQHHSLPVISGQALFSKYQKGWCSKDSFTVTQGV